MRQVGVALAVCLPAITFAAGQGNDAPGSTKSKKSSSEAVASDFDPISRNYVGYGSPMFNNSGCFTEIAPTVNNGFTPAGPLSCTADTRVLIEGTFGIWFKPYDGSREKVNRGCISGDRSFPT